MLKFIEPGPYLRERTTLRLGGRALAEVVVSREEDLPELPGLLKKLGAAPCVLGRGSNILAQDQDLPLALVTVDLGFAPAVIEDRGGEKLARVGANQPLPGFLAWCAKNGLGGLEGLAGIPGTVGGAVAMNAGSYGCEIGSRLFAVRVFNPEKGLQTLPASELSLGYRHFSPCPPGGLAPGWFVVVEAWFILTCAEPAGIKAAMDENLRKKAATQPISAASAGCVFKNPAPGVSAGKLLDEAGFKGKRLGDMLFSDLHANFLLNAGKGSSVQAMELLHEAIAHVYSNSGYKLEYEVKVLV